MFLMPFSAKQLILINIKRNFQKLAELKIFSFCEGVLFVVSSPLESQENLLEKLLLIFSANVLD